MTVNSLARLGRALALLLAGSLLALGGCSVPADPAQGTPSGDAAIESAAQDGDPAEPSASVGPMAATTAQQGMIAPNFEFATVDASGPTGATRTLDSYRGRAVVLTLWASWCKYCIADMPTWDQLVKEYGPDLVVIALNVGGDSPESVARFAKATGFDFVWGMGTEKIRAAYPSNGIPYDLIIDPNGVVVRISEGSWGSRMHAVMSTAIDTALGR